MVTEVTDELDLFYDLNSSFHFILQKGNEFKHGVWNSSSLLMKVIDKKIPSIIENRLLIENYHYNYSIIGKSGACGRWGTVMYIPIMDPDICAIGGKCTPTKGVFPAYLISEDCSKIYLVFMIGVGTKSERAIINEVKDLRNSMSSFIFENNSEPMDLGNDFHNYHLACIFNKCYSLESLPSNEELFADLFKMIDLYKYFKDNIFKPIEPRYVMVKKKV